MTKPVLTCVVLLLLCLTADVHSADFRSSYPRSGIDGGDHADARHGVRPDSTGSYVDSAAQADGASSRNDLEQYGFDVGHALSSPFRWDSRDLMAAGGVVAGTVAAALLDDECRDLMQRNQSPFNEALDNVGYRYGAPEFAGPGAILFYLTGLIVDDDWTRQTGLMLISTMSSVAIIQIPSRIAVGRARPSEDLGSTSFDPFGGVVQSHASFISGHAALAWGASTVLARRIDHPVATVALYSLAMTTSFVRLNQDAHWLSDVLLGSVLGYALGNVVVDGRSEGGELGMVVSPSRVGLTYRW